MIFVPQIFEPDESIKCIHCDNPYSHRVGGIVWQGKQDVPGFKETLICAKCVAEVIPGLVKDFMTLEQSMDVSKRRWKYIIDAGEKAKDRIQYAK